MSALTRYQKKITQTVRPDWAPPDTASFAQECMVLSFDQTLRRTGFVLLEASQGQVHVHQRGTARLASELKGFEETLDLADSLWIWLECEYFGDVTGADIVYEMPAVAGHRTESSLLAAYVVRDWAQRRYRTKGRMIPVQQSRTILGGSAARNDKKLGHQALARYIPQSASRTWNEHQRDAAVNGLAYLYTIAQERR